ncbi:MAG: hypothetical protein KC553_15565, partial [Nitrospina sp.]|nr:hypothetical protein [Nitrospina sp.]
STRFEVFQGWILPDRCFILLFPVRGRFPTPASPLYRAMVVGLMPTEGWVLGTSLYENWLDGDKILA